MEVSARYRLDPPVRMTIEYCDAPERCATRRITLYGVFWDRGTVSLEAWCNLARSRRIFDAGRIRTVFDQHGQMLSPAEMIAGLIDQIRRGDAVAAPAPGPRAGEGLASHLRDVLWPRGVQRPH